ncbi:MAG TPA: hypothetical protein DCE41_11690 [Cytophagales bacterium]|nr:hypothetical protein [Cytophagales bacterium]HAA18246.1 hypothetical protein [Cytophagales bacterium]HAP61078.1 hypothetical protein [Cytophagales bacterium]
MPIRLLIPFAVFLCLNAPSILQAQKHGHFEIQFAESLSLEPAGFVMFFPQGLLTRTEEGLQFFPAEEIATVQGTTQRNRVVDVQHFLQEETKRIWFVPIHQEKYVWLHRFGKTNRMDIWAERWSNTLTIIPPGSPIGIPLPFPGKDFFYQKDGGAMTHLEVRQVYKDVKDRENFRANAKARKYAREAIELNREAKRLFWGGLTFFVVGGVWSMLDPTTKYVPITKGYVVNSFGWLMSTGSIHAFHKSDQMMLKALLAYK